MTWAPHPLQWEGDLRDDYQKLIRERMSELGWQRQELARRSGINIHTLSGILSGKPPSRENLERLMEALGLTIVAVDTVLDSDHWRHQCAAELRRLAEALELCTYRGRILIASDEDDADGPKKD